MLVTMDLSTYQKIHRHLKRIKERRDVIVKAMQRYYFKKYSWYEHPFYPDYNYETEIAEDECMIKLHKEAIDMIDEYLNRTTKREVKFVE